MSETDSFPRVPQLDRDSLPGRQVKVSAICIGMGGEGDREGKTKLAVEHLHVAGRNGVDIALLPEEFAGTDAEPIPGPVTDAVRELAKQYNMYVICPIREDAADGRKYNTAVLIDRAGGIIDYYRKYFVYWGEGVHCGDEGVKSFELDFGRIAILTCFDLNFAELWFQCNEMDVDAVFWPSAYGGGSPMNAFAMLYHYYVIPAGAGNIIDVTGSDVWAVQHPKEGQFVATLDFDRAFIHMNFTGEALDRLRKEHPGEVEIEHTYPMEAWWLVRAVKPGVQVRKLLKEYGVETLREYQQSSRKRIDELRAQGCPIEMQREG